MAPHTLASAEERIINKLRSGLYQRYQLEDVAVHSCYIFACPVRKSRPSRLINIVNFIAKSQELFETWTSTGQFKFFKCSTMYHEDDYSISKDDALFVELWRGENMSSSMTMS